MSIEDSNRAHENSESTRVGAGSSRRRCLPRASLRRSPLGMATTFETDRDGRVLVVRFENPPRNFMDRRMVAELTALVRTVGRDRTLGAVVLTGKPDNLFVT